MLVHQRVILKVNGFLVRVLANFGPWPTDQSRLSSTTPLVRQLLRRNCSLWIDSISMLADSPIVHYNPL